MNTERAEIIENAKIEILGFQAENDGKITDTQLDEILAKYGTVSGDGEDKMITTEKGYVIKVSDIANGITYSIKGNAEEIAADISTAMRKCCIKLHSRKHDLGDMLCR